MSQPLNLNLSSRLSNLSSQPKTNSHNNNLACLMHSEGFKLLPLNRHNQYWTNRDLEPSKIQLNFLNNLWLHNLI